MIGTSFSHILDVNSVSDLSRWTDQLIEISLEFMMWIFRTYIFLFSSDNPNLTSVLNLSHRRQIRTSCIVVVCLFICLFVHSLVSYGSLFVVFFFELWTYSTHFLVWFHICKHIIESFSIYLSFLFESARAYGVLPFFEWQSFKYATKERLLIITREYTEKDYIFLSFYHFWPLIFLSYT